MRVTLHLIVIIRTGSYLETIKDANQTGKGDMLEILEQENGKSLGL